MGSSLSQVSPTSTSSQAPQVSQSSPVQSSPAVGGRGNSFAQDKLGKDGAKVRRGGQSYTVSSGDTLSDIAKKTYGAAKFWTSIRDANPKAVRDGGNLIYVGSVLMLPMLDVPDTSVGGPADGGASDPAMDVSQDPSLDVCADPALDVSTPDGGVCTDPALDAVAGVREAIKSGDGQAALRILGALDDATFTTAVDSLTAGEVKLLILADKILSAMNLFGTFNDTEGLDAKIAGARSQEVVVPTVLLEPAADDMAAAFKRANEIYNPKGIEVEQGDNLVISEATTQTILGADENLNEFTTNSATQEEIDLIKNHRQSGRATAYWVPGMTSSRGEVIDETLQNITHAETSIVVNAGGHAQDTFPHELGHALGLPHDAAGDANNLMADGSTRTITGAAGTDVLTDAQVETIRKSSFMEVGRKGVGK